MIIIDQITIHDGSGTGDNTVPPGIESQAWCHICSDASMAELSEFLTENFATIECPVENIRTPGLGANMTYAGLSSDQRDQAIFVGAAPQRRQTVVARCFDSPGSGSTYEP